MSAALTIDRRNLVDMEDYQRDRIEALKRRIECQDADIEYLHREILKRDALIEELGRGY